MHGSVMLVANVGDATQAASDVRGGARARSCHTSVQQQIHYDINYAFLAAMGIVLLQVRPQAWPYHAVSPQPSAPSTSPARAHPCAARPPTRYLPPASRPPVVHTSLSCSCCTVVPRRTISAPSPSGHSAAACSASCATLHDSCWVSFDRPLVPAGVPLTALSASSQYTYLIQQGGTHTGRLCRRA